MANPSPATGCPCGGAALPADTTRLVWFGNAEGRRQQSGMADLQRIWQLLEAAHRRHPLHLTVISNSRARHREVAVGAALPRRCRVVTSTGIPGPSMR